jgi:tripartite-type tricarboxylate transporter receptor subunit TctC
VPLNGSWENTLKLPHRRQFLHLAAVAAALSPVSRIAWAFDYPIRTVRIIVGAPPGGGNDIVGRLIGRWLSERLGQPFIVENRPGAGTNIGTALVAQAAPDGYTLLVVSTANATNASLYRHLDFNFLSDVAPIAGIDRGPLVMVVSPLVPAKSLPEFIAYAKAHPGVRMGSSGVGGANHIAGELFKMMAGIDLLHVPYRGEAPALTDLLSGQVQVTFSPLLSSIGTVRSGRLRALAVTGATRAQLLLEVPTVAEFLPGYEASQWYGMAAPRDTPGEIVQKLNREINAALADPAIAARLAELGSTGFPTSAAEFGKFIADETEKWGKVIRAANIQAE